MKTEPPQKHERVPFKESGQSLEGVNSVPSKKRVYEVILTRPATESTLIRVEANSIEEANDAALKQARIKGDALKWEVNEDNYKDSDEIYVGDEEGAEEVE